MQLMPFLNFFNKAEIFMQTLEFYERPDVECGIDNVHVKKRVVHQSISVNGPLLGFWEGYASVRTTSAASHATR
jgi:hypothetical protein